MDNPYVAQLAEMQTADDITDFFVRLMDQETDPQILNSFALSVMTTFTADKGYLVAYYCCRILINHGTPDLLEDILPIRRQLPPLPGLRDYRVDYSELVDVLTAKSRGICACIPRSQYNTSPRDPMYAIQKENAERNDFTTIYLVDCRRCGTPWKVTEETSYHYPLFHWARQP